MQVLSFSLQEVHKTVRDILLPLLNSYSIFTFQGPLGVGKTTLIRDFLLMAGVKETITSPTFTYVNIYHNDRGTSFYHFDLYRLASVNEFLEAGFDEYVAQKNSYCFIEWPEILESFFVHSNIQNKICRIVLDYDPVSLERRLMHIQPSSFNSNVNKK